MPISSRLLPTLAASALLLGSCGGAPEGQVGISEADRAYGEEQHPRLLAEFGGAYGGPESRYVAALGEKMAQAAGLGGQCVFTLVNTDVVNAFAVPGCYIYVTRGLFAIVTSEAELASVLGHEIGHIVGAHSRRQERRSIWRTLGVIAVSLTGSEQLTRLASQAAQYFTLRYSRGQEYESDALGIRYLEAAGYDPHAASDMLAALGRQDRYLTSTSGRDEASAIPEWARSHPLTENRIARARDLAREVISDTNALPENEAAYLSEVDGLLYGDDPEQGFVFGRSFAHPVMRIAFTAPPGFTLTNSPQAIMLTGPSGLRGEFGGAAMPEGRLDLYAQALIRQIVGQGEAQASVSQAVVNGLPAIFVQLQLAAQQGVVPISIATYDGGNGQAYHFAVLSPPAEPSLALIADLFRSFRRLSPEEAARLRPRIIRTVAAAPGDTIETLAARMADAHPRELFLLLNGKTAGDRLQPGEPLKIVTLAGR
ncbi:M48 family metalloprotease [Sphingomonas sp.]|jgi:predicted Zn-dependent protease|uniref:M48 family metalloprotease n=1 Tax=Sphingomonas sp. TaxID=28214 RepID=UPI002DEC8CC1|nr:M48 family metalloprotease [Sphingomonas sp.]HEV2568404.1 M48 family metalloprotease [Sphingomonas sp.]